MKMVARKWKYRLRSGKALRTSIENATDLKSIAFMLTRLQKSCSEVMEWAQDDPEADDYSSAYSQFEELYELLDGEPEVIRDEPQVLFEWGFTGADQLAEMRLQEFYDLCDEHRVWVEL